MIRGIQAEDTIAAISSPVGAGGIGVVRISGPEALPLLKLVFRRRAPGDTFQSHRFYYGHVYSPDDGKLLDEVLAVYMSAPHTYTREDVVEIHCHGSFLVLQNVLGLLLAGGARLAEPGEFTKRAFLNGRIDLTQAEAVIDILSAKTGKGVDLAQEQLSGALYHHLEPIRDSLRRLRAVIEVAIDFPDEDVEIADHLAMHLQLRQEVIEPLQELLKNADQGRIYREGIAIVIAGLPNVGKSSLLNTILQEDRALVTEIPGTTRDSIEEIVDIKGMPVRIIDTAGIRDQADAVEELGIKRTRELINKADLVLFLIDGSRGVAEGDRQLYLQLKHKPLLPVLNKIDLCGGQEPDLRQLPDLGEVVKISAREQHGIVELKEAIFALVTGGKSSWGEESCAPNQRHKQAILRGLAAAERAGAAFLDGLSNDLIAIDLQECLDQIADIVGETTTDDVLDVIFSQFCLGK